MFGCKGIEEDYRGWEGLNARQVKNPLRPSLAARGILPRDGNPRGGFSWQLRTPSIPWGEIPAWD